MAQRKKRRSKRIVEKQDYPGWVWMLFGLSIGLSVAFAVYVNDRQPAPNTDSQSAASSQDTTGVDGEREAITVADLPTAKRFTFYDDLPKFEVVIPEQEPDVAADVEPRAVLKAGVYVLQAGSFSAYADADRRRVQLAFIGIESQIQRVSIDDRTYHRVRIGPIDDLDELNILRNRLREERIEVLRIRLGD